VTDTEAYGEEGYTIRGQNRYTADRWSRKHTGKIAFCLGLFVGAGVTLLFTQVSGKEARGKIVEKSRDVTSQVGGCYTVAKDTVLDTVEKSTNWFRQIGPVLAAAIESGREAYEAEKSKIIAQITDESR
jgi:gas vesicle protein